MNFCEETVSIMMENFIKKFSKENGPDIEDIDAELTEVEGTISNERLWQKGSDTEEEILMFEQNITDHTEYINRLHELRAKRQKELKFIKKLEKSFGKDRNQMAKIFAVNSDQNFTFDDDKLYMNTKLPGDIYGKDIYNYSLVMTKEVFQECYNRWINPQEEGNIE